MPFVVGENIGPYRILEQLGQGGMATVFKAYHASLDRYVAIKALHPAFMQDPNFLARFQREARVVAKLEHPNIVPIYDFSEHEGRPYLVMKFIEGETLKARLSKGPLDSQEVLRITEAVGTALAYAHQQGILHRDVKPSNVLLTDSGQIYLADFGLARIAAAGESTLSSDMLVGTPQYISPEQAKGQRDLDEGTDIYSFGVLLYELVVGRVPYSSDTPYSIIHDHIYSPLPLPRKINPDVTELIELVLLKALAKDRTDRFPNVDGLVDSFSKAFSDTLHVPVLSEIEPGNETALTPVPIPSAPLDVVERPPDETLSLESRPFPIQEPGPGTRERKTGIAQKSVDKRKRWLYFTPVALVVFCLCGFITLRVLRNRGVFVGNQTTPQQIQNGLDTAREIAEQNPDDPWAHFDYAMALAVEGRMEDAQLALNRALDLAGEDYDFYFSAGDQLARRGAWLQAAQTYIRLVEHHPRPLPIEITNLLNEALYKASDFPDLYELIPPTVITELDDAMAVVVRARHTLYFEGPLRAEAVLATVLARDREHPEARLVQAEILIHSNANEQALSILGQLSGEVGLPEWIRVEAEEIIARINP